MDDILKPVKTVRNVRSNIERFETLSLRDNQAKNDVVTTKKLISETSVIKSSFPTIEDRAEENAKSPTESVEESDDENATAGKFTRKSLDRTDEHISSPEQALAILKDEPAEERFEAVIRYFYDGIQRKHNFNIHVPGAAAARILHVLVTSVIPDRWGILSSTALSQEDRAIRKSLCLCMSSPAGIGALSTQIQELITSPHVRQSGSSQQAVFKETVSFFASMTQPKSFVKDLLSQSQNQSGKLGHQQAVWAEATSLLAGSKVLNVFQEASAIAEIKDEIPLWLQDPRSYSGWLGLNIASAAISLAPSHQETWKMLAIFLKRALSLGYKDTLVAEIYTQLLLGDKALWTSLRLLSGYLPRLDQKMVLDIMLHDMSKKFLATRWGKGNEVNLAVDGKEAVGGVASVISGFIVDNEYLEAQLLDWLTSASSSYASNTCETRRAMILVLSAKEKRLQAVLEKSMKVFSDKLRIKHDSVLQQEALAQVILLTVGYLHRIKSRYLFEFSKSSSFLHSVSNRLAASLPRARFLGMVIGVAISRLVDPSDQQMNFDAEELETQEADWWFSLVKIEDSMGSVEALKNLSIDRRGAEARLIPRKRKFVQAASSKPTSQIEASKIISIEEVDDVSESEDDLILYQKPDEDPEDSDEDPTLINRSKPKAPIYINDLIKCLNVIDKPEVVEVALKTAPSLIRRKANFGTELSENIEVVASSLINLQEGLPNHDLQELRLQSLIACLVCQPGRMGPWFASMYFEGDFSLSQRASLLTTIGLSSREVAGHKDEGTPSSSHAPLPPSKELPPHLAAVYQPLNNLSNQIQHTTLRPMALAAADQATGPDILKIRTFSSRLAVEKRTNALALDRSRRIPKNLHKILAESIYLPLCCRMSLLFTSPSSFTTGGVGTSTAQAPSIKTNTLFDPHILKLFLQTLTIALTTLGPHAPQLPTVTRETLLLLTALAHRAAASGLCLDAAVLPAMLTLLLTTLDVNVEAGTVAEERLVTDFGDMVAELVRWVGALGESVRVPEVGMGALVRGEEEEGMGMPWTVVAAGIQVKWAEVGRKFQGTMMGLVGGMALDDF